MRSAFLELNIGSYGLFAAQQGLSVTSNNITNSNTAGYSRQVVTQKASKALSGVGTGMVGTGVSVTGIERIRNSYLDMKIWNQKPTLGEYRIKAEQSSLLEGIFGEPTDVGFTTIFNDLFKGFDDLAKLPDEGERKFGVMQSLKGITQYFSSTTDSLEKYQRDLNFEVKNKVEEINMITRRVESLNRQIYSAEMHGGNIANTLRDERELQIDRLSEIINVEVNEYEVASEKGNTEKRYSVKINGQTLVDHFHSRELDVQTRDIKLNKEDVEELYDVVWKDGLKFKMDDDKLSGELKGAIDMRDGKANLVVKANKFLVANKDGNPAQITIELDEHTSKDFERPGYVLVQGVRLKYTDFTDAGNGKYTFDIHEDDKETFNKTLKELDPVVESFKDLVGANLEKIDEALRVINIKLDDATEIPDKGSIFINGNKIQYTSRIDKGEGNYSLQIHKNNNEIFDAILDIGSPPVVQTAEQVPVSQLDYQRILTIQAEVGKEIPDKGYVLINGEKIKYTSAPKEDGKYKLTIDSDSYKTLDKMGEISNPTVQVLEDALDPQIDKTAEGLYTMTVKKDNIEPIANAGTILVNGVKIKYTDLTEEDGKYKLTIDPESYNATQKIQETHDPISIKVFKDLSSPELGDLLRFITLDADTSAKLPDTGSMMINGKPVKYTKGIEKDGKQPLIIDEESHTVFDTMQESTKPSVQIGEGQGYRGIPYYIHRLDNFVREFTKSMNGVYNDGIDENGERDNFLFTFDNLTDKEMKDQIQVLIDEAMQLHKAEKEPYALSDAEKEAIINKVLDKFYAKNLTASNFAVSQDILADVSKICTTKDPDKIPGGNDLLLDLMGLKHDRKMFKEGAPNDFMISIFSELGINAKEAKMYSTAQTNMVSAIENQRLSVSQVDQNEEMVSLVKYQQAYQAAARIISTMDTIYDITINRLGAS